MKAFEVGGTTLCLALFSDVTNSKELLDLMQSATLEPEVAFLNASLIPDVFPVLAAAHKTLVAKSRDSLTTRTPHSELVYNFSGSKHQISESLKRCGIADNTSYILAARFGASADEVRRQYYVTKADFFFPDSNDVILLCNQMVAIEKLIKGNEIDLKELEQRINQAQIQKVGAG